MQFASTVCYLEEKIMQAGNEAYFSQALTSARQLPVLVRQPQQRLWSEAGRMNRTIVEEHRFALWGPELADCLKWSQYSERRTGPLYASWPLPLEDAKGYRRKLI